MIIYLLHDPNNAVSRAVMDEYNASPRADVTVISDHALAVAACPNFSAYPAIVVQDGERVRVKSPVESWPECLDFIDNAPEPASPVRTISLYTFRTKVLTFDERKQLDTSTDPSLITMKADLESTQNRVVDLDEVAKYRPIMLATGLATEARIDEIIAGVMHV